jgi:Tol biopolymer transport system component/tRNA A-37 threonylcarbamoyl transferase component Bud32
MTDPIDRLKAALADRYTIEKEIGAGGMATVYLAEDIKHHRKVAIKLLKPELAAVLGAERFVQEIETTAALQHPHILPLFDSGEADGFLYYVMPFVDGETLRDKLNRETQFGIDEAIKITTEIADALHYAHSQGVVHRDIKPENILLANGRPMVADFGIALAVSAAAGGRMTETGLSLGTPHYMSPEQATAEKEITARSDVYSLGSMLYEMLAGEPPHLGGSAQQIIMKIIAEEAQPLTALRKSVPTNVTAAVAKSLEKLPADRFQSAEEFGKALVDPGFNTVALAAAQSGIVAGSRRSMAVLAGALLMVSAVAIWGWLRPIPEPEVARFAVGFSEGQLLNTTSIGTNLTVSRDGGTLIYIGIDSTGTSQLWVKRAEELEARPIPGTENGYNPFLSPEGRQLGFFRETAGRTLNLVSLSGGMPNVLYDGLLGTSGADWATDGYIYFDTDQEGIQRIRPDGSGRESVLSLDETEDQIGFAWPKVLPGDEVIITRLRSSGGSVSDFQIVASKIGTDEWTALVNGVSGSFHSDQLLFVTADGTLRAAPLELSELKLTGAATVLATGVRVFGEYAGVNLTVSDRGTVYYVSGPAGLDSHLVWVGPDGHTESADSTWRMNGQISDPRLSSDGRMVAFESGSGEEGNTDIWVKELPVGGLTRVTRSLVPDFSPSWSADGQSLLFTTFNGTRFGIYRQRVDGLGEATLVMESDRGLFDADESPDGRWIVAVEGIGAISAGMTSDLVILEVGRDSTPRPLFATESSEGSPRISPDGRWITYLSNASGRREVYVRPFPNVDDGLWQLSLNGARSPRWARSGRTLYFRSTTANELYAVDVETTPTFKKGIPRLVIGGALVAGISLFSGYDTDVDDSRFLTVGRGSAKGASHLVRIDNVLEDIRRRRVQ